MSHSITEKRTVISSSSTNYDDNQDNVTYYKSDIKPRNTTVQRSTTHTPLRTSGGVTRTVEMTSGFMPSAGAYANLSHSGVHSVKSNREREKQDMRDLNERFANYIEKVRFLEAQNKKLASELEELKSKWGKETSAIKQMYGAELEQARHLIDDTNKEKGRLELRINSLTEQLDNVARQFDDAKKWRSQDRELINKLNNQIAELEAEVRMLRRSNESLETERARDKSIINRLNDEIEKLRIALNEETLGRIEAENRRQSLEEEIEFLKSVHEQELKELAALAYRDTTAENREFWKNELSQAIRDIQNEYDSKVDSIRGDMEAYYNLKIQEYRTGAAKQNMEVSTHREEVKKYSKQLSDSRSRMADLEARNAQLEKQYQDLLSQMERNEHNHAMEVTELKKELTTLRSEMEGILQELQTLMDIKLSLELEIAAYRKLLEGEESRVGLKHVVEQVVNVQNRGSSRLSEIVNTSNSFESSDSNLGMKMMRGEVSAKTTYQRTQNGPVCIAEVNPEGNWITLENTGGARREVNLHNYKIKRVVDKDSFREQVYTFVNYVLKPGASVKIWARKASVDADSYDLVFRGDDHWRQGTEVRTVLVNPDGDEKACHNQKTLYT